MGCPVVLRLLQGFFPDGFDLRVGLKGFQIGPHLAVPAGLQNLVGA